MKTNKLTLALTFLIPLLFFVPLISAQTDSLAVWENIADGSLVNEWFKMTSGTWNPTNTSGDCYYESEASGEFAVSCNGSIIGDRWFHTFEACSDEASAGIASLQARDKYNFYAMVYYLSFEGGSPKAFIEYSDADGEGKEFFWDTVNDEWTDNSSNATDYSGGDEYDYTWGGVAPENYMRFKALWNWADEDTVGDNFNCTARYKVWDALNDDEPQEWMIDDQFSMYGVTTEQNYYSGIGNDGYHSESNTAFRRIFFWNLSFDYDEECHTVNEEIPYIGVPQYDGETLLGMIEDLSDIDFYNQTIAFRDMINLWDMTSYYDETDLAQAGVQNDTIDIFSIMTTGWLDFYEEYFDEEYDYEAVFPNNILVVNVFNPTDGTVNELDEIIWGDNCRLRFDFDGDGYDATDYTFLIDGSDTLFGYQGWTQVIPDSPIEWYGTHIYDYTDDDGSWGRIFRDYTYPSYTFFLNWDLISENTDVGTCVNISISLYDNETDDFSVWQDWDEQNDTTPLTPASDNATWQEVNSTTLWGIMVIEGDALDFDDPEEEVETETPSEQAGDYGLISKFILGLVMVFVALALLYYIVNNYLSKSRKTIKDMVDLFKMIVIVLAMLIVMAVLIAAY